MALQSYASLMRLSQASGSPTLLPMPTTIDQLKSIFAELEFSVDQDEKNPEYFWGTWSTESFVAPNGEKHIVLAFELTSDGNYFRVMAREIYNLKDSKFKGHALAVLAQIAFDTRSLQCEYDAADGEVRFEIDHWILDSQLTAKQVGLMANFLVKFAEEYHPVIVKAKDEGKIDFACKWERPAAKKDDAPELTPELAELLRRAGGAEGLAKLLAERGG